MKKTIAAAGIGVALLGATAAFGSHAEGRWTFRPGAWHGGGRGGPAQLCANWHDRHLDDLNAFVSDFLSLTTEQAEAWKRLADTWRAGAASIHKACQELTGTAGDSTPGRLKRVETMLETGLAVVRQLHPALDQFYALLTDEQKKALDNLVSRRHRH
jgi:hypothetical protein